MLRSPQRCNGYLRLRLLFASLPRRTCCQRHIRFNASLQQNQTNLSARPTSTVSSCMSQFIDMSNLYASTAAEHLGQNRGHYSVSATVRRPRTHVIRAPLLSVHSGAVPLLCIAKVDPDLVARLRGHVIEQSLSARLSTSRSPLVRIESQCRGCGWTHSFNPSFSMRRYSA